MRPREYFVRPACRSLRSKNTGTWVKPTHATMPRMYRSRSGIDRSASTTSRVMRRKSPVSAGMSVSDIQRRSR